MAVKYYIGAASQADADQVAADWAARSGGTSGTVSNVDPSYMRSGYHGGMNCDQLLNDFNLHMSTIEYINRVADRAIAQGDTALLEGVALPLS